MTMRLRELIRAVRACKTAAEERAVIAKESALIRTAIKDEMDQFRHRNVAKLLFIHMLGYPSHFGQMECLKLIASPHFYEKRIGYLGLSLLLTEHEEVLTLVTNSIKLDLQNPNPFVVGLALSAVGNLATEDIARDLAMDVDKHLRSSNSYLRKKAALTTIRIFKRVPELVEEFTERITSLLKDRSHGVLITGVQLMIEVVRLDEAHAAGFVRLVPSLVRLLRNLLTMGYAPDYDVAGITDPFLQVKLLCLLQYLGKQNDETSDAMNDILAQVATNTETAKNAGNAILYECVQTIMSIESETGLRVLAVNILGRFLLNRDNNIRYVALNTLSKVITKDAAAVQRHRNTIVDCLKDPDVSIRQRALELIYQLVNETNVTALVREMLNYLVVAPAEHKASICSKVMGVVETYAPSRRWRLDTLITMLSIAGQVTDDSIPNAVVFYISTSEDLQQYVVHKLFGLLKEDLSQQGLVTVAVWSIGELGELLLTDSPALDDETPSYQAKAPRAVVDLLERVLKDHHTKTTTKAYVLTTLMKLAERLRGAERAKLAELLGSFQSSMTLELQQRACEFLYLLMDPSVERLRPELLGRIPALDEATLKARRARFAEDGQQREGGESPTRGGEANGGSSSMGALSPMRGGGGGGFSAASSGGGGGGGGDLLDLDDIFGAAPAPASNNINHHNKASSPRPAMSAVAAGGSTGSSGADLLSDIFSSSTQPQQQQQQQQQPSLVDMFGGPALSLGGGAMQSSYPPSSPFGLSASSSSSSTPALPAPSPGGFMAGAPTTTTTITAFEKDGLQLTMELSKPNPSADPQTSHITCRFLYSGSLPLTAMVFQCAVPKYVKLEMSPASGTTVPANREGSLDQMVKVTNSMLGQKPLQIKIKIQYSLNGQVVTEMGQVSNFPPGY